MMYVLALGNALLVSLVAAILTCGQVVCPATTAWELHKKTGWPLHLVADAGHSAKEKGIRSELIKAADAFACSLSK